MTLKNARKLGFFAALAMLVGSVVGVGIFFKNNSIQKVTDSQGITWLLAWVVGGVISLIVALNFSEISFLKPSKLNGLSNWLYRSGGKKLGYFTSFSYAFFYYPIIAMTLGVILSEVLVYFIGSAAGKDVSLPYYAHFLIGSVFILLYLVLNQLSIKISGWVALISTILKFIPLLFALIIGIALANSHFTNQKLPNAFSNTTFDLSKLILALPGVLFAYDSFLSIGLFQKKVVNPRKTVPRTLIISMIIIVSVYSLIAVSSILHNSGTIWGIISDVFDLSIAKPINIVVTFFLLISVIGVTNAMASATLIQMQDQARIRTVFGVRALAKKMGETKAAWILLAVTFAFWILIVQFPSMFAPFLKQVVVDNKVVEGQYLYGSGTDTLLEYMSNTPTIFFFVLYGLSLATYSLKRNRISNPKNRHNKYAFHTITILGCLVILIMEVAYIYSLISAVVQAPWANSNAGFFASGGVFLPWIYAFVVFIVQILLFIGLPVVNFFLIKMFEKRDILKQFPLLVELSPKELKEEGFEF
ncbi:APC family permease [Mesomycoplasma hyorhinis]|uniref:APC family permease n=1 Tax=Mesomycoplasma hyorhinis TaxID=2100 RepID=UPI001C05E682|nr:amino acid permease [Mesomycoplasma hyorhinis]